MPLDGKRLKHWLFPSPEERKERRFKDEIERRKRFEQQQVKQGYELASLQRQEALAKRQAEIAEHRSRIEEHRARVARLQLRQRPVVPYAPMRNIGKDMDDQEKRLRRIFGG